MGASVPATTIIVVALLDLEAGLLCALMLRRLAPPLRSDFIFRKQCSCFIARSYADTSRRRLYGFFLALRGAGYNFTEPPPSPLV